MPRGSNVYPQSVFFFNKNMKISTNFEMKFLLLTAKKYLYIVWAYFRNVIYEEENMRRITEHVVCLDVMSPPQKFYTSLRKLVHALNRDFLSFKK